MCTGKCSLCIAVTLYPLALISIICNIVLFFPGGDVKYAKDGHITEEVKYMGGLIGGGLMVLLPALYIHLTGKDTCCGNRCGMFLSIVFAAVGVAGAFYSFGVAVLGLQNGPLCKVILVWTTPFKDGAQKHRAVQHWAVCHAVGYQQSAGDSLCRSDDQWARWLSVRNLPEQRAAVSS
ncbi:transmembrane 4 L6 family member 1 isoform X2 [Brachionichthys hirsutus]|uniref:transmembrane 4 L6 family member 1 isoform X2 n=1 Tax=Brachionichthys hirsutus TaxID=412623 RepID=UPI00360494C7